MRYAFLAAALCLASPSANAGTPQLGAVRPPGGQRGTEVEVTLSGRNLGDAQEILWYRPGIETVAITKSDDNSAKARIKIAPDARLGLYDLRVRTPGGVSQLQTFSVGQYPETSEAEPNNDFAAPQPIPMGVCVNGVAENEDVDYFVVEAKKGERITAEVEGLRLGISHFDPYVAILDAKRFELSSSDDAALLRVDAVASILAPEDGPYIIQVRESAYAGNGNCLYRLHVGHFPRPRAIVPAGGKLGETVQVRWIGDVAGDRATDVTLPSQPVPGFGLFAQDEQGSAPYPNEFRLSPFGNVVEVEPNDDHATATPFQAPLALNGVIDKPGDVDHFSFPAKQGQVFDIWVWARRLRSPLDPVLHIAKKGGNYIAGADDNAGPDSFIRFQAPEDGEYVVYLHDHLKKGGPSYFYRVELTPVEPGLVINPETEQPQRPRNVSVSVPKGNRKALLVYAQRKEFGGDLAIDAEALPPGVSIERDTMPANQPVVPVLFRAAPDAPVGGMLTRMTGAPTDPDVKVPPSTFTHGCTLVVGANNVTFWQRDVDRLAVAVAEELPFSIEVVEPKVPLVLGGTMNLKVVATRKEGFTAPISLRFPWLPPGVGASGGVQIPEGQTEAIIPMNANGAEQKSWKLVVDAFARGDEGFESCSSQLFSLTIAQPYLQFAYTNTACEQGAEADLAVKITKVKDFPGDAQVTLVGLPNQATTEVKAINKDTTDLVFHIKTAAETPVGNHANLFCQVVVTENGEPITHNLGTGALRVDAPIPPKANAPAVAEAPKAEAKPAEAPAKPLSRLEQLRQEAAERARQQAGGAGGQR
jgi:hypothetical protein